MHRCQKDKSTSFAKRKYINKSTLHSLRPTFKHNTSILLLINLHSFICIHKRRFVSRDSYSGYLSVRHTSKQQTLLPLWNLTIEKVYESLFIIPFNRSYPINSLIAQIKKNIEIVIKIENSSPFSPFSSLYTAK